MMNPRNPLPYGCLAIGGLLLAGGRLLAADEYVHWTWLVALSGFVAMPGMVLLSVGHPRWWRTVGVAMMLAGLWIGIAPAHVSFLDSVAAAFLANMGGGMIGTTLLLMAMYAIPSRDRERDAA